MKLLFLAVAFVAAVCGALADQLQCVSLKKAASEAGLTSLLEAIGSLSAQSEVTQLLTSLTEQGVLLPDEQRVTILAPTDAALADLHSLSSIRDVLLNHIIASEILAFDMFAAVEASAPRPAEFSSLLGRMLEVSTDAEDIHIGPVGTSIQSKVVVSDVQTCAGVMHVINTVLVPDPAAGVEILQMPNEKLECVSMYTAAEQAGLTTLLEIIASNADISQDSKALLDLATVGEYVPELYHMTLFAPTNEAFTAISPTGSSSIADVLLNHLVPRPFMASRMFSASDFAATLQQPATISTLLSVDLEAQVTNNTLVLTPVGTRSDSKVLMADVQTCAGIMHVVDTVLVPTTGSV